MKKELIADRFNILNEFADMYIKTAYATALEMTGCAHCARGDLIKRIHKLADRKSLEISLLYGDEWGEEGDPAISPDGITTECSLCAGPAKKPASSLRRRKMSETH